MDLRRLRIGEWITAVSGIVLLVSLFLPWWSIGDAEFTAWEALSVTDVALALLAIAAVVVWVLNATAKNTAPGVASEALLVPFALVMSVICGIRLLNVPGSLELPDGAPIGAALELGAWLGFAATLGVLIGVLVAVRDERLSRPGHPTDQTGLPVDAPAAIEKLPAPPPA